MCDNLPYESVYFKELHNEQKWYWPTIYRARAAVVSTIMTSYIHDSELLGFRPLRNVVPEYYVISYRIKTHMSHILNNFAHLFIAVSFYLILRRFERFRLFQFHNAFYSVLFDNVLTIWRDYISLVSASSWTLNNKFDLSAPQCILYVFWFSAGNGFRLDLKSF